MRDTSRYTFLSALLLAFLLLHVSPAPLAAQTFIHVDDDAPYDPGPGDPAISDPLEDGTVDHPFDAIQEGIDVAATGNIVLLADGLYTGPGNRDLSFLGKKMTVRSANGPESCTVDCEGAAGVDRFGFEFVNNEGLASVLQGLTITGASSDEGSPGHPHGVYIDGSSPTIIGNVVTGCTGGAGIWCRDSAARIVDNSISGNTSTDGGGIRVLAGSPLISDNRIEGNMADLGGGIHIQDDAGAAAPRIVGNRIAGNEAGEGGGIYAAQLGLDSCSPLIEQNVITGNHADLNGGGICLVSAEPASAVNNLLAGNTADAGGGGVYGMDLDTDSGVVTFSSSTIVGNSAGATGGEGGGVCLIISDTDHTCTVDFFDCILADNLSDEGMNLWLGSDGPSISEGVTATLDHCLIRDAAQTVRLGHMTLIQATPVLTGDPMFIAGPDGDYYLSQTADGQAADSPCVDTGSDLAANICASGGDETICMDTLGTRTTGATDAGVVDLGYHYPAASGTVSASMGCSPSTGTLPFSSQFTASLTNTYSGQARRIQHQIDVTLAGGQFFSSWRRGWQNMQAGQTRSQSWWQTMPGLGSLVGDTDFQITVADVTPPPYNLPPYPPEGDTDTAICTVTGVAP